MAKIFNLVLFKNIIIKYKGESDNETVQTNCGTHSVLRSRRHPNGKRRAILERWERARIQHRLDLGRVRRLL